MKKEVQQLPVRSFKSSGPQASKFEIEKLSPLSTKERVVVEPHRHDYYHVQYIHSGSGIHTIDFKQFDIKANSLFFISPGQVHSMDLSHDTEGFIITFDSEFYTLHHDKQRLINFPFFYSLYNEPSIYPTNTSAKVHEIAGQLYEEYTGNGKFKEDMLRAHLEILLITASRMYEPKPANPMPHHLVYQLRKLELLIDKHFKDYKLLDDYASMMHLSSKHLNSICKKGLNKTLTKLVHERLLLEAKRLLLFTDNTINEIALELGFTDKSYFMRFFKKHTKMTADAFRQEK
ncbi:helix-turn-helix domain-containing protein [Carboxylicivirga sp. RSCT41]|uniref:helix-turn-helix domain-containing protein n=1 Tax=Carboxylicivirga agarovorans TaxID=3417570 RepID=UPI003D358CA7